MLTPDYKELVEMRRKRFPPNGPSRAKVADPALGGHRSLFKGRGLDFAEFREYTPGDDIRSIDWRVTARSGKPHTKIFTEERERSAYVITDLNAYMRFGTRRTFKNVQAARAAALLAWLANYRGDKTGAVLFGDLPEGVRALPARRSRKAVWEMLRGLCTPATHASEPVRIEAALEAARPLIPTGASVFVISDFFRFSPALESALGVLSRKAEVTLVKISDSADSEIPPVSQLRFAAGPEGAALPVNTSDSLGAERYRAAWNSADLALREAAHRFGLKLIRISTEQDASAQLLRELHPRAGEKGKR